MFSLRWIGSKQCAATGSLMYFSTNCKQYLRGKGMFQQESLSHTHFEIRTYSKRKPLTGITLPGDSKVIYEAKLTKGDRILYTERQYNRNCSRSVIVWCVVQHKKVSAYAEKIRDAYRGFNERLAKQKSDSSWNSGSVEELLDETILWVVCFLQQILHTISYGCVGWIQAATLCSELLNAKCVICTVSSRQTGSLLSNLQLTSVKLSTEAALRCCRVAEVLARHYVLSPGQGIMFCFSPQSMFV